MRDTERKRQGLRLAPERSKEVAGRGVNWEEGMQTLHFTFVAWSLLRIIPQGSFNLGVGHIGA